MNHDVFDWDFENITHIARHGVTPEEAEQVLLGFTKLLGSRIENGELRVTEVGTTASGRILVVSSVDRHNRIRVVTAFEPNAKVKRSFLVSEGGLGK